MDNKIPEILKELKNDFGAISLKTEIANEIINQEELFALKTLADNAGLTFTLKTGGCEAGNDILTAKNINTSSVVAPMIESDYALKKFINKIFSVYSKEETESLSLYINIETITAFHNINEILSCKEAEFITGIIFGRDDMAGSMNIEKEDINSEYLLEIAKDLSLKAKNFDKEFILGGEIRPVCCDFLKKLYLTNLTKYETRKIIFDANKSFFLKNVQKGIKMLLKK